MAELFDQKVKLTASDIRNGMAKRWAAPEYAVMWEVGEGTGSVRGRYADAVIMSLWPSRGLELHGVEIKISRSDWKREAADPTKAEAIARYCDRWWIHTPPGIVDDLSALPPAWGLREFNGKSWTTIRDAAKTDADSITRPFLAAMLRRADETMRAMVNDAAREGRDQIEAAREKMRARANDEVQQRVERRTADLDDVKKQLAAFEASFGIKFDRWADMPRIGAAAKALADCGSDNWHSLSKRLRAAADEIDQIDALSSPKAEAS